jgi:acetyl-CoA carboxylase, biotin carboxylase subunit
VTATAPRSLRRVLVANRGEIAVRVVRACREEGIEAVVAVSDADRDSLAARTATDVVHIGPASPSASYLRVEQIVSGALLAGCDAVHPGYGFLSERPELAEACGSNGLIFVGPTCDTIRRGGDKVEARRIPDPAQGGRRWRWAGHGAHRPCRRVARAVRHRLA